MGCCCFQRKTQVESEKRGSKQEKRHLQESRNLKYVISNESSLKLEQKIKTTDKLKEQGNEYYKKKDYKMAILCYQKAILLQDHDISFYSNLALAYKMNTQYQESIKIVQKMHLVSQFKTHQNASFYKKGQIIKSRCIIILVKQYCLEGNYTILQNQKQLKLINSAIIILEESLHAPSTQSELKQYLDSGNLVLRFLTEQIIPHSKFESVQLYLIGKQGKIDLQNTIFGQYYKSHKDILQQIQQMVREEKRTALQDEKQYLIDPITYEIFSNPVLLPSGQTYDQTKLKQHFKYNGYKDPITKQQFHVGETVMVRNNNLKSFIHERGHKISKQDLQLIQI